MGSQGVLNAYLLCDPVSKHFPPTLSCLANSCVTGQVIMDCKMLDSLKEQQQKNPQDARN